MKTPDNRFAVSAFTGFSQVGVISVVLLFEGSQPPQYSKAPNKVMYNISMAMTIFLNVTFLNSLRMINRIFKLHYVAVIQHG